MGVNDMARKQPSLFKDVRQGKPIPPGSAHVAGVDPQIRDWSLTSVVPPECLHAATSIRKRATCYDDSIVAVEQCMMCGQQVAYVKDDGPGVDMLHDFDPSIAARWQARWQHFQESLHGDGLQREGTN
jgi:hypothetical protein